MQSGVTQVTPLGKDTLLNCAWPSGGAPGHFLVGGYREMAGQGKKDGKHSARLTWHAPSTLRTLWTHVAHLWVCIFCAGGSRRASKV